MNPHSPLRAPRFARQAFFWFCIALAIRAAFAVAFYFYSVDAGYGGFFPFESGSDDTQYYGWAVMIAEGRIGELSWYATSYPLLLGAIFAMTGPCLLLGILLNALASALCVGVAVLLCGACAREHGLPCASWAHPAHVTGLLLAFYPTSILYSGVLMRDELLLLSGLLTTLFALKLFQTQRLAWLLPLGLAGYCFFDLRSYAPVAFAAGCAVYFLRQSNPLVFALRRPVLTGLLLAGAAAVALIGYERFKFFLNPAHLEAFRASYSGGSSAGLKLDYSSAPAFLLSYAINAVYVLVSPVPWQVTRPQHALGLLESMPLLLLLPLWLWMLGKTFLGRCHSDAFLLITATFQILPYGLLSDNAGTNARLRLLGVTLFIVYCAVNYRGWLRARWMLRRRESVDLRIPNGGRLSSPPMQPEGTFVRARAQAHSEPRL